MKGLWYDKKLQQRTEIHSDNSFLVSFICLYLCAVLLYFATLSLYHREKKGSAKSVHASYKQFVIVKQENPAYLARRTQNLFHLGRSQNQPCNDMTASFKNKRLWICLNAVNETYFQMISTHFRGKSDSFSLTWFKEMIIPYIQCYI